MLDVDAYVFGMNFIATLNNLKQIRFLLWKILHHNLFVLPSENVYKYNFVIHHMKLKISKIHKQMHIYDLILHASLLQNSAIRVDIIQIDCNA